MKKLVLKLLIALCIVALGSAWYFYDKVSDAKQDPVAKAGIETANLVAKVGKLIILPVDEVPTVATVEDVEKLKDQPFFANAKVGFKVLLYANAKKAFLYDPVNNKVVESAPFNVD